MCFFNKYIEIHSMNSWENRYIYYSDNIMISLACVQEMLFSRGGNEKKVENTESMSLPNQRMLKVQI